MNLVVDLGNTSYKFAFFKGERCLVFGSFKKGNTREIKKFIGKQKKIDAVIVSSVVGSHSIKPLLKGIKNQFLFASQTNIPIKNLYKTPETLGRDRLAAAVGGYKKFPQKNVLVIDAGTCIKYDLVNSKGEYLGGGISPGLEMRFNALHQFTDRLPLIKPNYKFNELVGRTSEHSILSGVLNGVVEEVDGIITRYKKQYSELKVVVTGGDHQFFGKRLKNSIFADPLLVLRGLNIILNYNVERKD